jgi:hypothetical protein
MNPTCPECGAALRDYMTCQEIFDAFLVLEFSDPGYGDVHFLTVACFLIQHQKYSDAGLIWIEKQLRAHMKDDILVEQIRRRAADAAASDERKWKFTRQPNESKLKPIRWSMTIGDVEAQYQDAGSYRSLMRKWAGIILEEMQPWIE